jgi:hypothetical protein
MTLLIPCVHAMAIRAVIKRLHGNTLKTHFDLVW